MALNLFNYCPIVMYEEELQAHGQTLEDFLNDYGLDGIERFIYELDEASEETFKDKIYGTHLYYWPYWLAFWLGKSDKLRRQFPTVAQRNEYFLGALNREEWLAVIQRNIIAAASQDPKYMVWHVANADIKEIFTWKFRYGDKDVLKSTAQVVNAVSIAKPAGVQLLFENLWWPGLRLTDKELVKYFFDLIECEDVGIMLDTGHLMNTNPDLKNEQEAADYVCRIIDGLGEYAKLIKGVHLSCSLSGEYQKTTPHKVPANCDRMAIWKHVTQIDQHQPFRTKAAKQILGCVEPDFINHELCYRDLYDLKELLPVQLENCK